MAVSYSLNRLSIFRHFGTICIDYLLVSKQPDYQNKTTDFFNVCWILLPFFCFVVGNQKLCHALN